jgi:hypothetical protein
MDAKLIRILPFRLNQTETVLPTCALSRVGQKTQSAIGYPLHHLVHVDAVLELQRRPLFQGRTRFSVDGLDVREAVGEAVDDFFWQGSTVTGPKGFEQLVSSGISLDVRNKRLEVLVVVFVA